MTPTDLDILVQMYLYHRVVILSVYMIINNKIFIYGYATEFDC